MTLTQHSLLKFSLAMMLVSCTSSRNASKGLVACKTAKDCPAGYTCEQVPNSDAIYRVCCKDKGCAIDTTPGMGVDGSSVTSQDGQSSAFEAGYLVDGQPLEASTNPDLPDTDLKTLDAMGTCGNDDDDCPTTAPMCLNHFCAACTTSIDCAGNPSGDLCNTSSGRCAFCLADTDCKDASKPLCGQGKCTACTYATTANGCCADTDCSAGGANTAGKCDTSAHTCGYSCKTSFKQCNNAGPCLSSSSSCCADAECTGGPVGTAGKCDTTAHSCSFPCDSSHTNCNGTSNSCILIGSPNCCADTDCNPGYTCSSNTCTLPSDCTGGGPVLDCPCTTAAATTCSNSARPNKVPLICTGGVWKQNGATCDSSHNCDWSTGTCAPILTLCAGQSPGFAFCDYTSGVTTYKDVRKTCGPDLVTISNTLTCSGICDPNQGCLNPICGDGKVETGEGCDDGNTMALDGCEPATAPSGDACVKSKILSVSAGAQHTCGVFKGGYARCWGANDSNQLGLGHTQFEGNLKPYQLTVFDSSGNSGAAGPIDFGGIAVSSISAGWDFTCALLADKSIRCWGKNDNGQLGRGNTTTYASATPNALGAINLGGQAKSIGVGQGFACALLTNGNVRCWGANDGAYLGTGTTTTLSTSTPAQIASTYSNWISLGASATAIGVGASSVCALLSDSTIRCWGDNGSGQLGTGQSDQFSQTAVPSAYSAVPFPAGKSFSSIATGLGFSCARLNDGSAECWGNNGAGQLGLGSTSSVGAYTSPATAGLVVLPAVGVDSIFTGLGSNTCAFYGSGGGVHCWGNNTKGQLGYPDILKRGNASTNPPSNATQVPAINFGSGLSATVFSMGNAHACAILNTGELRCWGYNNAGQLGRGFTSASPADYVGGSATTTPDNAVTSVQLFP